MTRFWRWKPLRKPPRHRCGRHCACSAFAGRHAGSAHCSTERKGRGIVSLAGSAGGYLDIVYDHELMAQTDDASQQNVIKKEYKKIDKLKNMKDSEHTVRHSGSVSEGSLRSSRGEP